MDCLRCELARAKLWAILFHNTCRNSAELVKKLNDVLPGSYYFKHSPQVDTIYRQSNVDKSPPIVIWYMNVY